MSILHIFRGLPGSGKSTAARKLAEETGAILIEPDALYVRDGEYQYSPNGCSFVWQSALFLIAVASGTDCDIIFSEVLPRRSDVQSVIDRVPDSYRVIVHDLKITAEESKLRNRHNVRPEDIDRMAKDWEDWK